MQHAFKFGGRGENTPDARALPHVEYDFPADAGKANGIVLVGEAPGAEEARLGHPFVGRSGQLLDKVLIKAGIERKECLVANAFRMQPPGNKVDHFFISRRAAQQQGIGIAEQYGQFGSAFCRAEFAGELKHLGKTLQAYQRTVMPDKKKWDSGSPHGHAIKTQRRNTHEHSSHGREASGMTGKMIIVALGRTPMWALTGENGLLSKIGKPLPCRLAPGITVIPTFHPSFILRGNWAKQDEWLGHFITALKFLL